MLRHDLVVRRMWSFELEPESERRLLEIKEHLCSRFGLSPELAVKRINNYWRSRTRMTKDDIMFHETAEYWANTLFFGKDSGWWMGNAEREEYFRELEDLGFDTGEHRKLLDEHKPLER